MKHLRNLIISSALVFAGSSAALADPILGLWNTGVDANGNPNGIGIAETNYQISTGFALDSAYSFMTVAQAGLGASWGWIANPSDAAWIGPGITANDGHLDNDPVGLYFYDLTFTLGTFSTAELSGLWASDNSSKVFLNGNLVAESASEISFKSLMSFSVADSSLFNVGSNVLRFEVSNWPGSEQTGSRTGNPSGLLVSGLQGSYSRVPDGGLTAILLGMGLVGLVAIRRKAA